MRPGSRISSTASDLTAPSARLMRLSVRAAMVLRYRAFLLLGHVECVAARLAGDGKQFRGSPTSIRRWSRRFDKGGFFALESVQIGRRPMGKKR
jgi:hypothetical protein